VEWASSGVREGHFGAAFHSVEVNSAQDIKESGS